MVKEFTDADLEEIFSLRLHLEVMGARLACRRMGEEDFQRLEDNIGRARVVSKLVELTLLDVEFHDLVMQGAAHSRLQACWALVRHPLEYWLARMHSDGHNGSQPKQVFIATVAASRPSSFGARRSARSCRRSAAGRSCCFRF